MGVFNFGQKPCYRCGSKARVRAHKHDVLGEVYDVCCTNPKCGTATSRNYVWRHNAVDAWNSKPTVSDLLWDALEQRIARSKKKKAKDDEA